MIESSPLVITFLILLALATVIFLWSSFRRSQSPSTPANDPEGNRQHYRFEVQWPVSILTWRGTERAITRNLSLGGMFVELNPPLQLRKIYPMVLHGPDQQDFLVRGKVIWTASDIPVERGFETGMGIQFVYIDPDALNFLAEQERFREIFGAEEENVNSESND